MADYIKREDALEQFDYYDTVKGAGTPPAAVCLEAAIR